MDRNGYNPSLFETEDGTCYLCGYVGDTARHEIWHGPNRERAKQDGLWLALCPRCHGKVHAEDNGKYKFLKEAAQALWEYDKALEYLTIIRDTLTHELTVKNYSFSIDSIETVSNLVRNEFIAKYGRSYL